MQASSPERVLTGRHVLACVVAFFAVIFAANFVLVKLALDTLPGTDVDSAYRASLAYGGEIAAAHAQEQRGWRVAAHVERAPANAARVLIEARDATDAPLAGLSFSAQLARPTDRRIDRTVTISDRGGGVYGGEVADIPPGQWNLVIEATRGSDRVFQSKNRVMLP